MHSNVYELIIDQSVTKKITKGISLPKKVFDSLLAVVYVAIKYDALPVYGKKVIQCSSLSTEHREQIETFVRDTREAVKGGIFQPEKYTDPKGTRLFTLLPVYSFQLRHVEFDIRTFPPLLRQAGITVPPSMTQDQFRHLLWGHFDFSNIGIYKEEDLKSDKFEFWYAIFCSRLISGFI
jgi:hypothetical protein